MSYECFEEEFLCRTKDIISSYYDLHGKEVEADEGYEITLLLNCMSGLAAYPGDRWYNKMPRNVKFLENMGAINGVTFDGQCANQLKLRTAVHDIRNTIAHMGDGRDIYPSKIELNGRDLSRAVNIGKVDNIKLTCGSTGEGRGIWTININLVENRYAFRDFLFKMCDTIRACGKRENA